MEVLLHHIRHSLKNRYDVRYWARTWLFLLVDFGLLVTSTVLSITERIPHVFLVMACVCFAVTIVLAVPHTYACYLARLKLELEFPNPVIHLKELELVVETYPKHTFKLDSNKLSRIRAMENSQETFTVEEIAMCMRPKRSGFIVSTLQFLSDWLSFFASLMVFSSVSTGALSIVQGILAVVDLSSIFHESLSQYLTKYRARMPFCWTYLACYYWLSLIALFAMFFSGYTICLVVADRVDLPHNGTAQQYVGGVPAGIAPGFWTGWALTLFVIATYIHVAVTYACCASCGCISSLARKSEVEQIVEALGNVVQQHERLEFALSSLGRANKA